MPRLEVELATTELLVGGSKRTGEEVEEWLDGEEVGDLLSKIVRFAASFV